MGQLLEFETIPGNQRVTRVFPRSNCGNGDPVRQLGWQILEGVYRKINSLLDQRVIDLLGEYCTAAELGEGSIGSEVASGLELDALGFVACPLQPGSDVFGLPQSERAATGADPKRPTRCQC